MNIIIVDDNQNFRDGLRYFLTKNPENNIIAEYTNGADIIKDENFYTADIILMDIRMPKIDGYNTAKLLLNNKSDLRMIAVTMFQDQAYLIDLIHSGFKACVYKMKIYEELPLAIKTVMEGKLFYPEEILLNKKPE